MELNTRLRLTCTIDNEAENSGAVRRGHIMPCLALGCGLAEAQTDQTKGTSLNSTTGRTSLAESPQGQSPPSMQAAPQGSSKTVVKPH
jgi:hypothetical protein